MRFLGLGKVTKKDGEVIERCYIVDMTETEADMITGIAGRPHITGRYKPGKQVNIADIYNRVKHLNEKETKIKAAANETITNANEILNSFPIEG